MKKKWDKPLPAKPGTVEQLGAGLSVLICTDYQYHFNWMAFSAWYSVFKRLPDAKVAILCSRNKKLNTYLYHWAHKCDARYFQHRNVGDQNGMPYLNKIYAAYVALKGDILTQPMLVLDADMMAVSDFSANTLESLNKADFGTNKMSKIEDEVAVGPMWYFNNQPLEKLEEAINTVGSFNRQVQTDAARKHLDLLALAKVMKDEVVEVPDLGNEAQEDGVTTFTHYPERCASFQKSDWMKGKTLPPFNVTYALRSPHMSVNERKVLELWSQMASFYDLVSQVTIA